MKKLICLSIIFIFVSAIIFAQEEDLNPEQMKEYNRSKLSVDISTGGFGGIGGYGNYSYANWKRWRGYQGFHPVSEEDFFKVAGYIQESNEAYNYHETSRWLGYGGGAAVLLGTVIMLIPLFQKGYIDQSDTMAWVGGGILIAGTIPLSIGISRGNWAPVSQAQSVADEYNYELMIEMKKKF